MVGGQRLITVLMAYNAERTLEETIHEVPPGLVEEFVLVDSVLEALPPDRNSDDFVFHNKVLVQVHGLGVVRTSIAFRLHASRIRKSRLFDGAGGKS